MSISLKNNLCFFIIKIMKLKIGDVIKHYPEFTLALLNYHRRRSFYDQYPFEELEEK